MSLDNRTQLPELLMEAQVARLLSFSARTLQAWRLNGSGPPYLRVGRAIRYRRQDLIVWIEQNTVSSSTEDEAS